MHLYLIRHADAEPGASDAVRPLSAQGRDEIRRVGQWLRRSRGLDPAEFWHSSLVRARDTSRLLATEVANNAPQREIAGLTPDDDPSELLPRLTALTRPVAVVGHNPHLSVLATLLVTGAAQPAAFDLRKCTVLRLDRNGSRWTVRWLISPEVA